MRATRLLTLEDAPALAELLRLNRSFLAPWEPMRDADYFTVEGQQAVVRTALNGHAAGWILPRGILDSTGRLVGRITLSSIVRGPFLSCSVGFWIGEAESSRGLATAAVADTIDVAFDDLGLHRVQAEILRHNHGSRRVLERNGFLHIGTAPAYLSIAGEWQDHDLYQLINQR